MLCTIHGVLLQKEISTRAISKPIYIRMAYNAMHVIMLSTLSCCRKKFLRFNFKIHEYKNGL